jgi:hypothetical protein
MQQQRELFDESERPAKLSRKSDPITSQQSAVETEPQLTGLQSCCMVVLGRAVAPRTANEIAAECVRQYGRLAESYRKRLHELVEIGKAETCGDRACEITGKSAMTFRVKEQQ